MISYGIDIGTTTLRAQAASIKVAPFGRREVSLVGCSLCQFTPYNQDRLETENIIKALDHWAKQLPPPDLGTLLFTGEAQRTKNAFDVIEILTSKWEGLLCSQLNPDLESRLAAHGARAVELSTRRPGKTILHIDVGGGTSNLAWIRNGVIEDTACLDLGARKWIIHPESHQVLHRTTQAQLLENQLQVHVGESMTLDTAKALAHGIAELILIPSKTIADFSVVPWSQQHSVQADIVSLSGGIVECLSCTGSHPFRYGDIGPLLASEIVEVAQREGHELHLSPEEGRATAFGVAAHSFHFTGSSIHVESPETIKNVSVLNWKELENRTELPTQLAVYLEMGSCSLEEWVDQICSSLLPRLQINAHLILVLKENQAKALGYLLRKRLQSNNCKLLVLDEVTIDDTDPLASLNIHPLEDGQRYAVTVKSLRLF